MGVQLSVIAEPVRVRREQVLAQLDSAKVAIIAGAGITGKAAAQFFRARGLNSYFVSDEPEKDSTGECLSVDALPRLSAHEAFAVFSPGIAPGGALAQSLFERGFRSISELDLYGELINEPLVAVTGTNGKSTVTSLIHEMLIASGSDSALLGNIGVSFFSALTEREKFPDKSVCELSSYQLEWCDRVTPLVSVFLNLAENHLERHLTMANYFSAKAKIFRTQSASQFTVLNRDDFWCIKAAGETSANVIRFGVIPENAALDESGYFSFLSNSSSTLTIRLPEVEEEFDLTGTRLIGFHNRMNLAAAIPAALLAGATRTGIQRVIADFQGLEHRLELVQNPRGLKIVNDSKATTAHAAANDLKAVLGSERGDVHLLIGGLKKIGSWKVLAEALSSTRVPTINFFGKDGAEILDELRSYGVTQPLRYFPTLKEALRESLLQLGPGDTLLFAPGCPSFDAYSGFEERGRHFKQLVQELVRYE